MGTKSSVGNLGYRLEGGKSSASAQMGLESKGIRAKRVCTSCHGIYWSGTVTTYRPAQYRASSNIFILYYWPDTEVESLLLCYGTQLRFTIKIVSYVSIVVIAKRHSYFIGYIIDKRLYKYSYCVSYC